MDQAGETAPVRAIVTQKVLEWMARGETGLSSEAMAYCAAGIERTGFWTGTEHPHDVSDLRRCFQLVEQVPEVRHYFSDIACLSDQWHAIIGNWDELLSMFQAEAGNKWPLKSAPKTYERLRELISV